MTSKNNLFIECCRNNDFVKAKYLLDLKVEPVDVNSMFEDKEWSGIFDWFYFGINPSFQVYIYPCVLPGSTLYKFWPQAFDAIQISIKNNAKCEDRKKKYTA